MSDSDPIPQHHTQSLRENSTNWCNLLQNDEACCFWCAYYLPIRFSRQFTECQRQIDHNTTSAVTLTSTGLLCLIADGVPKMTPYSCTDTRAKVSNFTPSCTCSCAAAPSLSLSRRRATFLRNNLGRERKLDGALVPDRMETASLIDC